MTMYVVIDINTLAMVFNEGNARHPEFCAVAAWINSGDGIVVYGGTKYKAELALMTRYMRLLRLLHDGGRAITIRDAAVDALEHKVREKTQGTDCDDQHVIALLGAARCPLLCSADTRSFKFVQNKGLYPKGTPTIKIFTSNRNSNLLKTARASKLSNVDT
jgi:hypothetical protein